MPTNSRRLCDCHSEPMNKNGTNRSGSQKWLCTVTHEGRSARTMRATRAKREAAGLCVWCGTNPHRNHSIICRPCSIADAAKDRALALARNEAQLEDMLTTDRRNT